jgi:magnesium chelatase family protein
VLEVLRQPLEEGCVRIARALRTVSFPARFMLIGAMNPCPCGYHGDPARPCRCSPMQIARYASRLSGPLRDRMDLTVPVAALSARELAGSTGGESSAVVRARVVAARERQLARDAALNARLQGRTLRARTRLDGDARRVFDLALTRLALTARGHDRVLRVARTIADLDRSESVLADHLAEALQFRGE